MLIVVARDIDMNRYSRMRLWLFGWNRIERVNFAIKLAVRQAAFIADDMIDGVQANDAIDGVGGRRAFIR